MNRDEIRRRFPNASEAFVARNTATVAAGIHPAVPKPNKGHSLEKAARGKEASCNGDPRRFKIVFRVRRCNPQDWDNAYVKCAQDLLVKSGALPGDQWSILQGEVIPEKVNTRAEEGTLIEIYEQPDDLPDLQDAPSGRGDDQADCELHGIPTSRAGGGG